MSNLLQSQDLVEVEPIVDKIESPTPSEPKSTIKFVITSMACFEEPWSGHESWQDAVREFRQLGWKEGSFDWQYPVGWMIVPYDLYIRMCRKLLPAAPEPPPAAIVPILPPRPLTEQQKNTRDFAHTAKFVPILEPLSQATQTLLQPILLAPSDRLLVRVDDDLKKFIVEAYRAKLDESRDEYSYASDNARYGWLKRVPEKKEVKTGDDGEPVQGRWKVAATDITVLIMYHNWPEKQIVFADESARAVYQYVLQRFLKQHRSQVIQARFKVDHQSPEMPKDFIEHPDSGLVLAPAQKAGMLFTLEQEGSALFCDPGTGKTAISVARICLEAQRARAGRYLNDKGEPHPHMLRVLIVVPRQVRRNWEEEIHRFSVVPGKASVLRGGELRRTRTMIDIVRNEDDCAFGACICSYGVVENTWEAICRVPWDLIILDESHLIKSGRTARAKICRELIPYSRRRMILTGTPIANSPMDLWSQFEFLGEGLSGFLVYENYKAFYGKWQTSGHGVSKLLAMKNVPLLQERLARLAFMVTKKDAGINLPDKVYDLWEVTMTSKQRKFYIELQKQLAMEIEDLMKDTTKRITADHILKKMLRLAQITAGHIVWDPQYTPEGDLVEARQVEQIDPTNNPKVEAVIEILTAEDRDPLGKTIIWALWHEDLRVLREALRAQNIDFVEYYGDTSSANRDLAVERFNKDHKCKVWIGSAACGGVGLNLLGYDPHNPDLVDTYCDQMIFFTQGWSAIERAQAEDRAHRRGTRCSLRITDLVVLGTIDEEIRTRVRGKQDMAKLVQDIQVILQRVCKNNVETDDD